LASLRAMLLAFRRPGACASTKFSRCATNNQPRDAVRRRLVALASAALAGALLLSAVVVAPLAFRVLPDDHAQAGALAGQVFAKTYWCALVVGVGGILLGIPRRPRPTLLALLLAVLSYVQLGLLAPLITAHGQGWPYSFAALHGTASAVHLALLAVALALAWIQSDPVPHTGSSS